MTALQAFLVIAGCGAIGGFANVFNSDGFHLPQTIGDVWSPGYLGTVFVGAVAAVAAWGVTRTEPLGGVLVLQLKDVSYALVIGFSGAKWLSAEWDKRVLQKTAAVAASKAGSPDAAAVIASSTPRAALRAAIAMK